MALSDFISNLVRWMQGEKASREEAKNRLQLILIQDRSAIDPTILDALRDDLVYLMGKYFDVSDEGMEVDFQREGESVALVANVPIRSLKGRSGGELTPREGRDREPFGAAETIDEDEPSMGPKKDGSRADDDAR